MATPFFFRIGPDIFFRANETLSMGMPFNCLSK